MQEQSLYHGIRKLLVLLEFGSAEVIRPFHLTVSQFDTLQFLSRENGVRMGELCQRLICDNSKMTRIIDALEKRQLVERQQDPNDRRVQAVFLTQAGLHLREHATAVHHQHLKTQFASLTPDEKQTLSHIINKLNAQIGDSHE
jgi:MarR family 2-MHQ and catechol resistance regulon transcriptional repressor